MYILSPSASTSFSFGFPADLKQTSLQNHQWLYFHSLPRKQKGKLLNSGSTWYTQNCSIHVFFWQITWYSWHHHFFPKMLKEQEMVNFLLKVKQNWRSKNNLAFPSLLARNDTTWQDSRPCLMTLYTGTCVSLCAGCKTPGLHLLPGLGPLE